MSLLWRNQMQVFLAPDRVNLTGTARGIRPVQQFSQSGVCVRENDSRQWKASLQLLEQMLKQVDDSFRRSGELYITLSNHFVRYGVIAPQPSLANPDELIAYAGFQMREIYGERIDEWELSLSTWDPYSGALCAAIARDLQSELESLANRCGTRLAGIEPYLAAALDHWAKQLTARLMWFVLVETGRFCLVVLSEGVWRCARNQRVVQNLQEELLTALEQESIILSPDQSVERVYVFAPESTRRLPMHALRWQFVHLSDEKYLAPSYFPRQQK
ncbi:hypothetical protein ABO04_02085 [Nitrosomonas sp. HPC101]|uniref:hypothetical protein n=1 Tax=Nitrosomonas sp. HPC101 TaxID=1658667 RepID=UPI001368AC89|nr:hypothetical protein [Nitrosomonas sp. HPC101]MXS84732.1 hypothetical protein [Nitrosomonas sp. HPC101]